jgi:large subunit ribosomal protein L4
MLKRLGLDAKRTLLVLDRADENVVKSCRNIANLRTTMAHQVNPYDLLDCEALLVTKAGLDRMKEVFAG